MHEIMTIEEVAAYLRVSERTVYDWAQKGELPGGKLGTTWRFKRQEVENWVNSRLSSQPPAKKAARGVTSSSILTPERVVVLPAADKLTVLTRLVDLLSETSFVRHRDELLEGILAREELMSTGIGFGVAVPHVRIDSVRDLAMAVAVCKQPVADYASLDGEPVQIVCMLAARTDQHTKYIRTLASISSRLKEPAVRASIIGSNDPSYIYTQVIASE